MSYQLVLWFPIAVLANNLVIETYHHGQIFEGHRASLQSRLAVYADPLRLNAVLVLLCPYCLSHWTGGAVATMVFTHLNPNGDWMLLPVYALAVARGSNLLNDVLHDFIRTPKHDNDPIDWEAAEASLHGGSGGDNAASLPDGPVKGA